VRSTHVTSSTWLSLRHGSGHAVLDQPRKSPREFDHDVEEVTGLTARLAAALTPLRGLPQQTCNSVVPLATPPHQHTKLGVLRSKLLVQRAADRRTCHYYDQRPGVEINQTRRTRPDQSSRQTSTTGRDTLSRSSRQRATRFCWRSPVPTTWYDIASAKGVLCHEAHETPRHGREGPAGARRSVDLR
jgi:hypothetical protein